VEFATFPETVVLHYPYFSVVQTPLQNLDGGDYLKLLDKAVTVPSAVTDAIAATYRAASERIRTGRTGGSSRTQSRHFGGRRTCEECSGAYGPGHLGVSATRREWWRRRGQLVAGSGACLHDDLHLGRAPLSVQISAKREWVIPEARPVSLYDCGVRPANRLPHSR
jgi:hypothetical protein